jgi:hypothetical protein
MEDKVKFVVITLVRSLWYEDHSRGFQNQKYSDFMDWSIISFTILGSLLLPT